MRYLLFLLLILPTFCGAQSIVTIAGDGTSAWGGDGPQATATGLSGVNDVALDKSGNLYILEDKRIKKVSSAGVITTIAGNGVTGVPVTGGPATATYLGALYTLHSIAVDANDNVYYSCSNRIYKVSSGILSLVAGGGGSTASGIPATDAYIDMATGLYVDAAGNIYFAQWGTCNISKVTTSGLLTTYGGNGSCSWNGDGGAATSTSFNQPFGITMDASGNVYIVDVLNRLVRRVSPTGIVTTIAGSAAVGYSGDGGPATDAGLVGARDIAVDKAGNIYLTETNAIRGITTTGTIYTIAGDNSTSGGYYGDGGPASAALLKSVNGIALDTCGNLYIADAGNYRIRKMVVNPDCYPTAVDDVKSQESVFSIFPHPAGSELNVRCRDKVNEVTIVAISGQLIFRQTYNSQNLQIDISSFAPGIYLLRVNGGRPQRFVKN